MQRGSPQRAAAPAPPASSLAAEEAELRARVRSMRLKKLAEETALSRVALTREGAQIRQEIARLRAQITLLGSSGSIK